MTQTFDERAVELVVTLGLLAPSDIVSVRTLTGGVASDIGVVQATGGAFCVKFALGQLRVAQNWQVPISRNRAEYDWLAFAGTIVPGAVPQLFGHSAAAAGFVMELIGGPDVVLWKTAILSGQSLGQEAAVVADALGRIHNAGSAPSFDRAGFNNRDLFRAIRIEPYLSFTATRHPAVAVRLNQLADGLYAAHQTLVHGDISPKNILIRPAGPVFLDAECATMGDPAFDLAFCINHLVLKAAHVDTRILTSIPIAWAAYAPHVTWEGATTLQARVAALVPALMLARIDGKSPVEYLSEPARRHIRQLALGLLAQDHTTLGSLVQAISDHLPIAKDSR
jgi:5-methylthioribose kinase